MERQGACSAMCHKKKKDLKPQTSTSPEKKMFSPCSEGPLTVSSHSFCAPHCTVAQYELWLKKPTVFKEGQEELGEGET